MYLEQILNLLGTGDTWHGSAVDDVIVGDHVLAVGFMV